MRTLSLALVSFVLAGPVTAQLAWLSKAPSTSPSDRSATAMVYDAAREVVVLFGGLDSVGSARNDTWEWDGVTWTQRSPVHSPPRRHNHQMSYDVARERVVLFGGIGAIDPLDDTWEWNGSDWVERFPSHVPPARQLAGMAYDVVRQRTTLFGGLGSMANLGDTWEWDGLDWFPRVSIAVPSPRAGAALAYDASHGEIVLFGGGNHTDETWVFDSVALMWVQRFPAHRPPARSFHAMTYHAARGRVLLHGGVGAGTTLGDTWEWNGVDWQQPAFGASEPGPRANHAMAYDASRERSVLFGGVGVPLETWEYTNSLASYVPFGHVCSVDFAGTPMSLAPQFGSLPWIGSTLRMTIGPRPTGGGGPHLGLIGASNTQSGSLPLPIDLTGIGMLGCELLIDVVASVPLTPGPPLSTLSWSLPIPSNPGLIGYEFYVQAWVTDFSSNPFGAVLTDGGIVRIGSNS